MKKLLLFSQLALLPLVFPATAAQAVTNTGVIVYDKCVHGNGIIKTVERKVDEFTLLETEGAYDLRITSGIAKQQVKITGEANLLPLITTSSQGNKLVIKLEKSICTEMPISVEVKVGTLNALVVSGSENVNILDLYNEKFILDMSGSGEVELSGIAIGFDATMSGAGDLEAKELKTKETVLNITGTGTANVHASERLKVKITGVADVNYFGNPKKIEKEIIGVGELTAH